MAADKDTDSPPPADRLEAGREGLRSALKWMIGGFGAIGASLAVGSQLSDLGKTTGNARTTALIGGALAFIGIFLALWLAVKVLTASHMTLGRLGQESRDAHTSKKESFLVKFFERENAHILGPYKTLANLQEKYTEAHQSADQGGVAKMSSLVTTVTNVASYEELRHNFHEKVNWIVGFLGVTALGILLFSSAVKGEGEEKAEAAPAVALQPVPVNLSLTAEGKELLADSLGSECVKETVSALVLGGDREDLEVVSLPTPDCQVQRFRVSDRIGILTPAIPVCRVRPASPEPQAPPECGVFP